MLVSSFEPLDIRASQMFAEQQKVIGVKINVESLDPATLRKRRQPAQAGGIPDYDAYFASLESHGHIDPDGIYYFYHSPGKKGFGAGVTGYGNPKLDAIAEQASTEPDLEKRKEMISKSGQMGVPVIYVGNELVVGFDKERLSELLSI